MTTGKPRGPYAKGEERRRDIIRIATDVFATEGFEGAAVKQVAELVGISEGTLFHYFRTKQELLQAVLSERDERSGELLAERGFFLEDLPAVAARNEQEPGLTLLYAVASATAQDPGHTSHHYFRERYATVIQHVARDIAEGQNSGEYRTDIDPEWAARLVVGMFDGLQTQWLYDKSVSMPEGLRQALSLLKAHR